MLISTELVTDAFLMPDARNQWASYYKWLQEGKWSWSGLPRQFVRLALSCIPLDIVYLIIDDSLTLRASKKAPGSQIHHQHGNKPNLTAYVRGQCGIRTGAIVRLYQKRKSNNLSNLQPEGESHR